jgi:dienelactone hydrolase
VQTHSGLGANPSKYIKATLEYLISQGCAKIGAVGYCAGAPQVLKLLAGDEAEAGYKVEAGYIAHPAGSPERLVENIIKPLSIVAADEDASFTDKKRYMTEEILKSIGVPYQINLYSHVRHGFAGK